MKDGFIKVAAATPKIKVADPAYNTEEILKIIDETEKNGANILVFSELTISGYTCGDLFLQQPLLTECKNQLLRIVKATENKSMLVVVGCPIVIKQKLYNCAVVISDGSILGIVPKTHLPNYSEFYELRHFTSGEGLEEDLWFGEEFGYVNVAVNQLFKCKEIPELVVACEICEDLWVPLPPSTYHAMAGATVICNPSASVETTTKESYRRSLVSNQSARLLAAYIYADAGEGESTQDVVYSGHHLICENGSVLAEAKRFTNEIIYADIDVQKLAAERRKMTSFPGGQTDDYFEQEFSLEVKENKITRTFPKAPFVPDNQDERDKRCDEILSLQSMGLKKRLEHTNCKHAVVGISGGLDSTLAVLVTARAFDLLDIPRENLICVTMPCFGTTDRTYQNAVSLIKELGATLKEVRIEKAVRQHFADIGHDENNHDVTYENSQARERTQILMDMANQYNGMVIGTGDMSELALGWATYNGDHMSMYAVNCSVPKTLVRYLVLYYAETTDNKKLSEVLMDVLDTPVSPELLPPVDGVISQKTEDLVGPYELHDFFLYYMLRFGFPKAKLYRMAKLTFDGVYDDETIKKWLDKFYWRFFSQQFKRSCLPDGPKVGSVAVSPRGDLRMPSDASPTAWL
ncbi:NAD(+) synthase [Anaerostipes hadrus]|uniref:NAD(+) synthase n=1 Tax=Anaerostipes hadrus TaxID=649756 RepID=UPI001D07D0C5|nr:NAD(+) synthase [Anaerostipes hadrus]MCB6169465.1 NAD(+) synthase [Anaerostipes hadrus]MCB6653003.1 NAD(+) synthase [Anaerostipes hadrus]MCB6655875.1 NAD(+) synthase [Anaerostipes hadrus]MCB6680705.1 NAD(+) synthase [Anaerostipes hadrus]MCB6744345.1 NAD(+) synthase [Anaerostipes hadrus]